MAESREGLVEAPVLRPSQAQWANPLAYVASVAPLVSQYGACRLVPPAGWAPPFAMEAEGVRLRPVPQRTAELLERDAARSRFLATLRAFLDGLGTPLRKPPLLAGKEV